jgi:hypothetical protein
MMAACPSGKMRAVYFSQTPVQAEDAFESCQTRGMQKAPTCHSASLTGITSLGIYGLNQAEVVDYLLAVEVVRVEAPIQEHELVFLGEG